MTPKLEERYKRMIADCLQQKSLFGVALIRRGRETFERKPEPFPIGCSAHLIDIQNLDGGRMNIVAIGVERFRILKIDPESQPYLVGVVQPLPIQASDSPEFARDLGELRRRFESYLQAIITAEKLDPDTVALPDDPIHLAYLSASILQITLVQKQAILSILDGEGLIKKMAEIFLRENALLSATLSPPQEKSVFSRN